MTATTPAGAPGPGASVPPGPDARGCHTPFPGGARTVAVAAPGKINASFRVGPPRADGYHGVASLYLAVSLEEEVRATARPGTAAEDITVSVSPESTLDASALAGIPLDATNLAVQAALLVAAASDNACGVHLEIVKRVPIAGGMGGGSADAAAAMLACATLWDTPLSRDELLDRGAALGADVPFALLGGAAVGLGVGDRLTGVPAAPLHWVLVQAGHGLSTPTVYRTLDTLRAGTDVTEPDDVDPRILAALAAGNARTLAPLLHNDLQDAALDLAPGLRDVLADGRRLGALAALVSGSGPTVALLAADSSHAERLGALLRAAGRNARPVRGPAPGARRTPPL